MAFGATDPLLLLAAATAGNTLGAVFNWSMGRLASNSRWRLRPIADARFQQASRWVNRWGIWSLLLSWMPVIGDPLTLVAGALRTSFVPFLVLVLVGKTAPYAAVLLLAS